MPLPVLFVVAVAPGLILLALLVPPGQVADEPPHAVRVAGLADGIVVGRRVLDRRPDGTALPVAGLDVDPAAVPSRDLPARLPESWSGERAFTNTGTIATYTPTFYSPAALGFALAKAAGASPVGALRAGRLAGALAFLIVGAAALTVAVRGQALLFSVLAVPMTVSLGASLNQDGLLIATAVLAVACMTRVVAARADGERAPAAFAGAALALALVAAAKPPYLPVAAILLLPLGRARDGVDGRALALRALVVCAVALPALAWTAYAVTSVAAPVERPPYEAGPLWPGPRPATFSATDTAAQLKVLLDAPYRLVTLPWRYLTSTGRLSRLGLGLVGMLGWHDLKLHAVTYAGWALAFGIALWALARPAPTSRPGPAVARPGGQAALVVLACLATLWLVLLSQYLTWTNVGENAIWGPQGRYLLPILPLLALLPPRDGRLRVPSRESWALVPAFTALAGTVDLYRLVSATYGA